MGFSLKHMTKLTAVICGCLLIVVSIISFAVDSLSPILAILDIYYIFFGISLMCAEWEIIYVVQNFKLLSTYFGRGIFCFFLGTILLDDSSSRSSAILSLIIGIFLLVVGVFYEILAFKLRNEDKSSASAAKNVQKGVQDNEQQRIQNNV